MHERRNADGSAVFPDRFPTGSGRFRVATLEEELELITGLNASTGRLVGIYPEIKRPAWHRAEGVELATQLLEVLDAYGYRERGDPVYVQCFDAGELKRLRHDLRCDLKLVQLIGENDWRESDTDYEALKTERGLGELARTVDGIGPWLGQLCAAAPPDGHPIDSGLARNARRAGLEVHPWTFRADVPTPGFADFDAMVRWFVERLGVEGLFTDFPDRARRAIDAIPAAP